MHACPGAELLLDRREHFDNITALASNQTTNSDVGITYLHQRSSSTLVGRRVPALGNTDRCEIAVVTLALAPELARILQRDIPAPLLLLFQLGEDQVVDRHPIVKPKCLVVLNHLGRLVGWNMLFPVGECAAITQNHVRAISWKSQIVMDCSSCTN